DLGPGAVARRNAAVGVQQSRRDGARRRHRREADRSDDPGRREALGRRPRRLRAAGDPRLERSGRSEYNVVTSGEPGMRGRLVRIGNSRGVRIPKAFIDEAALDDEIEMSVRGKAVVIASAAPRSGWAEAARRLRARGQDRIQDPDLPTRFDREDWEWR